MSESELRREFGDNFVDEMFYALLADPPVPQGYIYFIQRGDDGPIKVGISKDPANRLNQLQTANAEQLNLILTFRGCKADEAQIHSVLKNLCIGGEWFDNHPFLQKFIEKLRAHFHPPARRHPLIKDIQTALEKRGRHFLSCAIDGACVADVQGDELYFEFTLGGTYLRRNLVRPENVKVLREVAGEIIGKVVCVRTAIR